MHRSGPAQTTKEVHSMAGVSWERPGGVGPSRKAPKSPPLAALISTEDHLRLFALVALVIVLGFLVVNKTQNKRARRGVKLSRTEVGGYESQGLAEGRRVTSGSASCEDCSTPRYTAKMFSFGSRSPHSHSAITPPRPSSRAARTRRTAARTSSGVPRGRMRWRSISPQKVILPRYFAPSPSMSMQKSCELTASIPISIRSG